MPTAHWYTLTRHLKKAGTIKNGLTIPYLYGAYQHLGYNITSIEDLLTEILNAPAPFIPVIERCDDIKWDVLQLETEKDINKYRDGQARIYDENGNNFFVVSYNTNLGNTLKNVANALSGLYQKQIRDRDYSWNNEIKRWQKLSPSEIESINRIR